MKRILVALLLLVFLSACSATAATSTPQASATSFDGSWKGSGASADGRIFSLILTIQDSSLTYLFYNFPDAQGISCFTVEQSRVPKAQLPIIQAGQLSATFGEDVSLNAEFAGTSASGHLTVHSHGRVPRCNGDFEIDWTAEKQNVQIAKPKQVNPFPFQTLIQIIIFGLSTGAVLALNAIGVTLIYGAVRILNLAHGDVFALTTVLVTSTVNAIGIQLGWAFLPRVGTLSLIFLAALGFGALLSVGVDRLAFRPFRGRSRLAPLIATLGLSFILFQGAIVWRTFQASWIPGEHRSVPGLAEVPTDGIPSFLPNVNLIQSLGLPFHIIIRLSDVLVFVAACALVLLATWFLQKTNAGRALRALSQNPQLAQIVGVNLDQTIRNAFAVGGAFAGAAGFIFAIYYARPFGQHGAESGLMAFAAALLGGIGSPIGALISGLLIGVASALSDYYLSAQWTPTLLLALLILLLAWKPTGLASSNGDAWSGEEGDQVRDSVILSTLGKFNLGKGIFARIPRWLVILILMGALPLLLQIFNFSGTIILRTVGIFILLALGLNLVLGVAGILDLGFAVCYGAGAYVAANLSGLNILLVLLIAAILTGLIGWIKGVIAYRLRGDFLAVATLALGLLGGRLAVNLGSLTGGPSGLSGFSPAHFLDLKLVSPLQTFYLVFGVALLATWLSARLIASRTGRSLIASSEDELAAISMGINSANGRILAFVLSSALAGLAGALYASTFAYADPSLMGFPVSAMILAMVILGGAGDVSGAIIGALTIVLYDKVIVPRLADLVALIWPAHLAIGSAPDIRGASFFNFGIALYLTVLLRARRKS